MPNRRKHYLKFQAKILIPVIAIMVVLVTIMMMIVNRRIESQLETQAKDQLRISAEILKDFRLYREQSLKQQYHNLAKEPRLKAIFSPEAAESLPTLQDNCEKLMQEFGDIEQLHIDGMMLTSVGTNHASTTGRTNAIDRAAFEKSAAHSIALAFQGEAGEENVDTVMIGDRLFDLVSIPVLVDNHVDGVLTFALRIDKAVAEEFRRTIHNQIVFLADGRVVASTMRTAEFNLLFVNLFNDFIASSPEESRDQISVNHLMLGKSHALSVIGAFQSLNVDEPIGYMLLASYEDQINQLADTQWILLTVSLAGILLSALIILVIVRTVTSPLRQLRASAEAIGYGDFTHRVEISSQDEYGELADAFNQMIENLKTSRAELEKTVETLKTTQAQLVQREKLSAIGEFIAGVAHELNNPLTSVIGFAQLVQQSTTDQQHHKFLDRVVGEAQRCAKIVQSLLSFARQHPPERKMVDINQTLEAAVDILRYQLRTSGIQVITKFDPELPQTLGDAHQLQQVFVNIINNARQAIETFRPNGLLIIVTEHSESSICIFFEDNGPGIARENLNKIFDPFFTTKEIGKGTGLGLSLAYGIIQEHSGSIHAQNNVSGEGASFIIELPIARDPNAGHDTAFSPAPPAAEGDGKRLLVVDDEDSILELAREILVADHYRVEVAHDGVSALQKIHQRNYDLVVCDMKMPDLNGQQVYERLHASNPAVAERLIFMTGDVINEKTQDFFERHGKVCLIKPFTLEAFRAAVSKTVSHS